MPLGVKTSRRPNRGTVGARVGTGLDQPLSSGVFNLPLSAAQYAGQVSRVDVPHVDGSRGERAPRDTDLGVFEYLLTGLFALPLHR